MCITSIDRKLNWYSEFWHFKTDFMSVQKQECNVYLHKFNRLISSSRQLNMAELDKFQSTFSVRTTWANEISWPAHRHIYFDKDLQARNVQLIGNLGVMLLGFVGKLFSLAFKQDFLDSSFILIEQCLHIGNLRIMLIGFVGTYLLLTYQVYNKQF